MKQVLLIGQFFSSLGHIGYIEDTGNGKQTALDKNAMVIGKGNQLMGLIYKGQC